MNSSNINSSIINVNSSDINSACANLLSKLIVDIKNDNQLNQHLLDLSDSKHKNSRLNVRGVITVQEGSTKSFIAL